MPKPTNTIPQITALINELFDSKYDCSKIVYTNNHTPVILVCPDHGEFKKTFKDIKSKSSGCPKCGNILKGSYHKKDTAWFIEEAAKVHGSKYDYSQVVYTRTHTKVTIICPEHGEFNQTPASHLYNKCGCNPCSVKDYTGGYGVTRFTNHPEIKTLPARLYLIQCASDSEHFVKIGITQKSVIDRFTVYNHLPYNFETLLEQEGNLYDLFLIEQDIKKQFKKSKYRPSTKFHGHTECFTSETAPLILEALSTPTISNT